MRQGGVVSREMARNMPLALVAIAYFVVATFALSFGKTLCASGDMGFHLQTVELLRDHLFVPASAESFQREMFAYPRWSYRLAAPALWVGLSSPNALGLAATAAAGAVWLITLGAARRLSQQLFLAAFLCGAAMIVFLGATFGAEVVGNYFYPQLIGEPFAVGLILGGAYLIGRSRRWFAVFALAAVWVCGQFHLIAALRVAGGLGVVLLLEWARTPAGGRLRGSAWLSILPAMGVVLLLNPAFSVMRRLSIVNGDIGFARPLALWQLEAASVVLLALSGAILARLLRQPGQPNGRAPVLTFFAALGVASASAALAQAMAFTWLGESSPYAVKKHAFGVFTALAFVVPIAAGLAIPSSTRAAWRYGRIVMEVVFAAGLAGVAAVLVRRVLLLDNSGAMSALEQIRVGLVCVSVFGLALMAADSLRRTVSNRPRSTTTILAGVLAAHLAVMELLFFRASPIDAAYLSKLLADTAAIRSAAPDVAKGYLFASSRSSQTVSFLVNMAALRIDRQTDPNYRSMLLATYVLNPELAPNLITEVGDLTYDIPGCRRGSPQGSVVVVEGACTPAAVYDFGAGDPGTQLLTRGWSVNEQDWTWSDGPRAVIDLPLPASMRGVRDPRVIIHTTGFLSPQNPHRTVHAVVEGGRPQTHVFDADVSGEFIFLLEIPPEAVRRGTARIVFTIDDPQAADASGSRRLGVAVWRLVVYPKRTAAFPPPSQAGGNAGGGTNPPPG